MCDHEFEEAELLKESTEGRCVGVWVLCSNINSLSPELMIVPLTETLDLYLYDFVLLPHDWLIR